MCVEVDAFDFGGTAFDLMCSGLDLFSRKEGPSRRASRFQWLTCVTVCYWGILFSNSGNVLARMTLATVKE